MARRNDHTREELKKMAISAGQKIITNEGSSKFSARKTAKEIGYTVGTIYNIFKSHDDLILHVNAATLEDMRDYISRRTKNKQPCADAIKNLAASYIAFAHKNHNRWISLFEFNLQQNVPLPDWYTEKIKALFLLVEAPLLILLKGNTKEIKRNAKVLWAGIHGICQLGFTGTLDTVGAESVRVLTNSLIDNYMRGLTSCGITDSYSLSSSY